jgi:hypothetical protein
MAHCSLCRRRSRALVYDSDEVASCGVCAARFAQFVFDTVDDEELAACLGDEVLTAGLLGDDEDDNDDDVDAAALAALVESATAESPLALVRAAASFIVRCGELDDTVVEVLLDHVARDRVDAIRSAVYLE